MTKLEAYQKILKTIMDCAEQAGLPDIGIYNIELLIKTEELQEEFGIANLVYCSHTWFKCGYYSTIGLFGEEHNRTISWPDDGRQPEDEWLYHISFPTGAYIFGEDYCTCTFDEFFAELKTYNPKYLDSANHSLYFTSDTAAKVHAALPELLKKYGSLVQNEINVKRILKLQEELKALGVDA